MSTSGFFCSVCVKTYANRSNLRTHIQLCHPDQLNEIAPKKKNYDCEFCSETFKNKILFNRHRKVHTSGLKCPLCEVIDVKPALIQHFTLVHNVDINIEQFDFQTFEEFNSWKEQIEEENTVFFSNRHGTVKSITFTRKRYECNRSGAYQSQSKGSRHLKNGSKRMNAYCPASIILDYKNGIYNVKYTSTHIGHTNELRRIPLTKTDRLILADKVANKIPFDSIIEDIKGSLQDSNLERIHLVTKQDLRNIKRDFHLDKLNNDISNMEYPEKLQQKKKYDCKEILNCKNNGIKRDGYGSQIADESNTLKRGKKTKFKEFLSLQKCNDTTRDDCEIQIVGDTNNTNTENSETLEPMKKKKYKEIFIKNNCDTQDDANVVHEIEELETLEASNEIQEFLSRYESIDIVEDNNDIEIAGAAFELVVDDFVHLVVDNDTIKLIEENLNYGINLEKRETLEKLKEKMKKTFLEALDKATTYEQCELIRKIIAPLHPTLDKCNPKGEIEEEFDFTPAKCIVEERTQKELDPTLAKCISEKGTEVLDSKLVKCIPKEVIEKELYYIPAKCISKQETKKDLGPTSAKCKPKKGKNKILHPALAKCISDDGTQNELDPTPAKCISDKGTEVLDSMLVKCIPKEVIEKELYHIPAKCISTEETKKDLGPTSAKCKPEKGKNKLLHPALDKCISDDGTQNELDPTPAKCIPEKGTVEELDPTSGESKNRLNCKQKELITPTLDVLKNRLSHDQKQSAITLNYKPLAYKCILIKKKS
ncbi:PREDICTED: uncharacterized protein LOC108566907 isoform X2 [Nicrophorus vespilloides]|uniref:Uncharacterized protein LOC108566907 isoform X2 n=1 Tax=Nicrophorus vespilloides TaxID=110193 RepID=A0ABM1N6T1_NICVS|nr:PREDICTED: uncharacterized protein LOC108566907 isoform X2 [Nicrophorus vespilloides]